MLNLRSFIRSILVRDISIQPATVRPGDDIILALPYRLDSDDAFALLHTIKEQFPGVRIHLLTGFGQVQIQRGDSGSQSQDSNDRANPPLPVRSPTSASPFFKAAASSEQADVVVITYATDTRLVAVYIPPKQKGNSVSELHSAIPPAGDISSEASHA